jgi:hypothetical protein
MRLVSVVAAKASTTKDAKVHEGNSYRRIICTGGRPGKLRGELTVGQTLRVSRDKTVVSR